MQEHEKDLFRQMDDILYALEKIDEVNESRWMHQCTISELKIQHDAFLATVPAKDPEDQGKKKYKCGKRKRDYMIMYQRRKRMEGRDDARLA